MMGTRFHPLRLDTESSADRRDVVIESSPCASSLAPILSKGTAAETFEVLPVMMPSVRTESAPFAPCGPREASAGGAPLACGYGCECET